MIKKGVHQHSNSIMSSGLMQRTISNSSKSSSCFDTLNEESDESDTNDDGNLIQFSSSTRTTCTIVDNNKQKLMVDKEINATFNMETNDCDEYRFKSSPSSSLPSTSSQQTNAINQRRLYARSISFAGTRSSSTRLISSSTRRAIFFQRHDGRRLLPSVSCE